VRRDDEGLPTQCAGCGMRYHEGRCGQGGKCNTCLHDGGRPAVHCSACGLPHRPPACVPLLYDPLPPPPVLPSPAPPTPATPSVFSICGVCGDGVLRSASEECRYCKKLFHTDSCGRKRYFWSPSEPAVPEFRDEEFQQVNVCNKCSPVERQPPADDTPTPSKSAIVPNLSAVRVRESPVTPKPPTPALGVGAAAPHK